MIVFCCHCEAAMEVASRNFKSCADCKKALARERNKKYAATPARSISHARYEQKRSEQAKGETAAKRVKRDAHLVPRALLETLSPELQALVVEQARDDKYGNKISGHGRRVSLDSLYQSV